MEVHMDEQFLQAISIGKNFEFKKNESFRYKNFEKITILSYFKIVSYWNGSVTILWVNSTLVKIEKKILIFIISLIFV